MKTFFYLEGGYLILAVFILAVTLFVTTRPFMGKGALKKGMLGVGGVLVVAIAAHYYVTTKRMQEVKSAFQEGRQIICESRMIRKGAQSVVLSRNNGWELKGDYFESPVYVRPFFTARCIVYK